MAPGMQQRRSRSPINMERLWAGDRSQLPPQAQGGSTPGSAETQAQPQPVPGLTDVPPEEDEEPLICMICEDKATGLHYGIITCEG